MRSRGPGWLRHGLAGVALLSVAAAGVADGVYKTVDESGNVTYSATPPDDAIRSESVAVPPPPSKAQQQEARRIERQIQGTTERTLKSLEQARRRDAKQIEEAKARLQAARNSLEKAKTKSQADWQYLAQGGRVLKQSYFRRVEAAEKAVEQAEEALAKARRDRQ